MADVEAGFNRFITVRYCLRQDCYLAMRLKRASMLIHWGGSNTTSLWRLLQSSLTVRRFSISGEGGADDRYESPNADNTTLYDQQRRQDGDP